MTETPNLGIEHMTATQSNKEVTANAAFNAFDGVITGAQTIPIDDSNAHTLSTADLQGNVLFILEDDITPPDADVTLTIPGFSRGVFVVWNNTSQTVNASISGQSEPAVVILAGAVSHLDSDGVDVKAPATSSGVGTGGTDGWENEEFIDVSAQSEIDIAIPANIIALKLTGWVAPSIDGSTLAMLFSIDGGSTFPAATTDYSFTNPRLRAGSSQINEGSAAFANIRLATAVGNSAGEKVSFSIIIIDPRNAAEFTEVLNDNALTTSTPNFETGFGGGGYNVTVAVDFLRLIWGSGNITGKIMVQKLSDTV